MTKPKPKRSKRKKGTKSVLADLSIQEYLRLFAVAKHEDVAMVHVVRTGVKLFLANYLKEHPEVQVPASLEEIEAQDGVDGREGGNPQEVLGGRTERQPDSDETSGSHS